MSAGEIRNIKVSIQIKRQFLNIVELDCLNKYIKIKKHNNFIVLYNKFVYTIFRESKDQTNHINITKIPDFASIPKVLHFLSSELSFDIIPNSLRIDNITGSLNLNRKLLLGELIQKTKTFITQEKIILSYNNEKFPGLFMKISLNSNKIGTIIVFASGKIVFVGCKSISNLECLTSLIHALTQTK